MPDLLSTFNLSNITGYSPDTIAHFQNTLDGVMANPNYQQLYQQLLTQQAALLAKGPDATPEEWSTQKDQQYMLVRNVMQDVLKKDPTLAPVAAQVSAPNDPYLPRLLERISKMPPGNLSSSERLLQMYTSHQVGELFPELGDERRKLREEKMAMYADGKQPTADQLADWQKREDVRLSKFRFAANLVNPQVTPIFTKIDKLKSAQNKAPATPPAPTSNDSIPPPVTPSAPVTPPTT